jgi:exodeoxyribonuclease VII large subunit
MDRVAELRRNAWRSVARILEREAMGLAAFRQRPVLASPYSMIDGRRSDLEELTRRARACVGHRLDRASDDLEHTLARVRALSPMATLERGYSIVLAPSGHAVRGAGEVGEGDVLDIRLASGRLGAVVSEVVAGEASTEEASTEEVPSE